MEHRGQLLPLQLLDIKKPLVCMQTLIEDLDILLITSTSLLHKSKLDIVHTLNLRNGGCGFIFLVHTCCVKKLEIYSAVIWQVLCVLMKVSKASSSLACLNIPSKCPRTSGTVHMSRMDL